MRYNFKKFNNPIIIFSSIVLISFIYFLTNTYYTKSQLDSSNLNQLKHSYCQWTTSMPILYNIKTKLGVTYDAGHWFHMAENIMVQHSILRSKNELANSSLIYYNFDQGGFESNLNGITRFFTYLGTASPGADVKGLKFFSDRSLWGTNLHFGDTFHAKITSTKTEQFVNIEKDVSSSNRFVQTLGSPVVGQTCIKYGGTLGGLWPTPQRGSWFVNENDISTFRRKILDACPPNSDMLSMYKKNKKYKLVLYQRDLSRKLINQEETINALKEYLNPDISNEEWEIQVIMHSSKRSPCELVHMLHNTDVLITPHGFQSMLLLFLPRPSILFEIFPYKYWKRGYGPLSKEYGVIHGGVMSKSTIKEKEFFLKFISTGACMLSKFCRGYAREQDVIMPPFGVTRLINMIKENIYTQQEKPDMIYNT